MRCLLTTAARRLTVKTSLIVVVVLTVFLLYVSFQASTSIIFSASSRKSRGLFSFASGGVTGSGPPEGKVILMTYGRSGSSFTSEIIQRDANVFYTFEPLYNLIRRFIGKERGRNHVIYPNNTAEQQEYDRQSIEILDIFLTCEFEALQINDIANFQLRNSGDSRKLWYCVQRTSGLSALQAVECFIQARQLCLQKPVRMVKTIRLRGVAALRLMEKHPDLHILYLVRDPRGTIASQRRVFNNFKWEMVANFSDVFCQTLREDLAVVRQMLVTYGPGRVKILRYERLAHDPIHVSEELYTFLGLNYTDAVRQFVFNKTMAGENRQNAYATTRSNSTEAANSWRSKLSLPAAQTIDSKCRDLYEVLGYIEVNSLSELTDISRSLWRPTKYQGQVL